MKSPDFEHLLFETDSSGIAILTINRPKKLNALNNELLDELKKVTDFVEESNEVKALIITGAGDKAFVAGADIKELSSLNSRTGEELSLKGQQIFLGFETCSKPVIAVVNGYALGGGAELAMACHIRIATKNAVFGLPEVSLGLIPGYGGTQRLPQLVGKSKAMEMILTGTQVNADEAKALGLVNDVYESGEVLDQAKELARKMIKNAPIALSNAIKSVNAAYLTTGYAIEAENFGQLCETDDFAEGTTAFLEKRKADFKGK